MSKNKWFALYVVYGFAAIAWSDLPFVALKRWIKTIGEPVMVIVLMTEPVPMEALSRLMKRCAYVLIPMSITFIKYFPQLGRTFDVWSGGAGTTGVAQGKNGLGYLCMVLGTFLFCHLLSTRQRDRSPERTKELILAVSLLSAIWWLLIQAQSSTSLMGLLIAMAVTVMLGLRAVSRKRVGTYVLVAITALVIVELTAGLSAMIIQVLGEDSTLTGRTDLWQDLLGMTVSPLFGAGFESFWLGARLEQIWSIYWWRPTQSHNGYLEVYLNLGAVGLFLLCGVIVATFRKGTRNLLTNFEFGRYQIASLIAIVVYNWTEAAYKTLHLVFVVFCLIAISYPNALDKQKRPAKSLAGGTTKSRIPPPRSQARRQSGERTLAFRPHTRVVHGS